MILNDSLRAAISRHALDVYPHECCGLVVDGHYLRCSNVSADPRNAFEIYAEDFANAEDRGEIQALVHSHPGRSAKPSQADLTACEDAQVPVWVIVSLGSQADGSVGIEEWCEFGPSGYEAPLIGCEFSHGVHDCYGLVRRYYKQIHGIMLKDFERSDKWWDDGHSDLYTQGYAEAGFVALPQGTPLREGDVLLMKIASRNNVPNHAAVYIGGDQIMHHLCKQLSRKDGLPRYREHLTHHLRHRDRL